MKFGISQLVIEQAAYLLFCRFEMWVDRLVCAIAMNNTLYIVSTQDFHHPFSFSFMECPDKLAKKQMCEILAKHRLSHLIPLNVDNEVIYLYFRYYTQYVQLLSSSNLSDWYTSAAKALDISLPRTPDNIITIPSDKDNHVRIRINLSLVGQGHNETSLSLYC